MRTYGNKRFNFMEHVATELKLFLSYCPPGTQADGELYRHRVHFQSITSITRQKDNPHPEEREVHYYLFDLIYQDAQGTTREQRREMLERTYRYYIHDRGLTLPTPLTERVTVNGRILEIPVFQEVVGTCLQLVPVINAYNHEEVVAIRSAYERQEFEGAMLKKLANGAQVGSLQYKSSLYRPDKGTNILKFKTFQEEEAVCIGVTEGEGREAGVAIFTVKDKRGNILDVRPKGKFELRRHWFQHPEEVIGKEITIKYQELTVDGVFRFPVVKAIRDYE